MSLDESYVSNREAVQRGHDDDERRRKADWDEQRMLESDEAMVSLWRGVFQRMDAEREAVHYLDATPDRRLFAIEGDLIEQARRDADPRDAA